MYSPCSRTQTPLLIYPTRRLAPSSLLIRSEALQTRRSVPTAEFFRSQMRATIHRWFRLKTRTLYLISTQAFHPRPPLFLIFLPFFINAFPSSPEVFALYSLPEAL